MHLLKEETTIMNNSIDDLLNIGKHYQNISRMLCHQLYQKLLGNNVIMLCVCWHLILGWGYSFDVPAPVTHCTGLWGGYVGNMDYRIVQEVWLHIPSIWWVSEQ